MRARREVEGVDGVDLKVMTVPHGGKGAAVRAGMLAADADLLVFADADMATPPDELPLLAAALVDHDVALGSRIQPDGSDMRKTQPAYRRALGRVFHIVASAWVVGPVKDTQCGFKGFRRDAARDLFGRQRITSIVFDVEVIYLARRRGYRIAIVPIHWYDRRGSRMRAGRPGHPGRLGPVPDPADPPRSRPRPRPRRMTGDRSLRPLARAALPIVACLTFVVTVGATLAVAGDTRGYDFLAYHQAATRLLHGQPVYDLSFEASGAFGLFYYPPTFVPLRPPVRPAVGRRGRLGLGGAPHRGVPHRHRDPPGLALGALVDRAPRRPFVAVRLRGQARAGGASAVPHVRDRLAVAG